MRGIPARDRRTRGALGIAIAALACACAPEATRAPDAATRTILLISIDTLRPDRLGVYGNTPDVSPALDALAKRATVFDQALSPSPWTAPSHMTMLTGLDPVAHGVWNVDTSLADDVVTLAEQLRAGGFRTAAFTDGGFVHHRYGFGQGFEIYDDERTTEEPQGFTRTIPRALAWIREAGDEPFFLFLHTLDTHAPYDNVDPEVLASFRTRRVGEDPRDDLLSTTRFFFQNRALRINRYPLVGVMLNDYDAGVHAADRGVGALIDLLEEIGRFEDALVIVTSDHGESFLDHGAFIGHGMGLRDDEIGIPLIVRFPGGEGAGQRVDTLVDLLDVAPTVLAAAGEEAPPQLRGEDLRGLVRGRPRERSTSFGMSSQTGSWYLVEDGFKYISAPAYSSEEIASRHLGPVTPTVMEEIAPGEHYDIGQGRLGQPRYDWRGDPLGARDLFPKRALLFDRRNGAEHTDLSGSEKERLTRMRARIEAQRRASLELSETLGTGDRHVEVDAEARARLEALGYLGPMPDTDGIPEIPPDPTDPADGPDMTSLRVHDRRVHAIRIRLLRGGELGSDAREQLREADRAYADWGEANAEYAARSLWRGREVAALAERAGIRLDAEARE